MPNTYLVFSVCGQFQLCWFSWIWVVGLRRTSFLRCWLVARNLRQVSRLFANASQQISLVTHQSLLNSENIRLLAPLIPSLHFVQHVDVHCLVFLPQLSFATGRLGHGAHFSVARRHRSFHFLEDQLPTQFFALWVQARCLCLGPIGFSFRESKRPFRDFTGEVVWVLRR
jgi:hypothetical protein